MYAKTCLENRTSPVDPPQRGRFVVWHALVWLMAAPLLGTAVARAAVWIEHFRAPLVIFPLLAGCGLGLLLVLLMRLAQIGHRPTLLIGAVLAVIAAVAGQHGFSYLDYRAARAEFIAQKHEGLSLEDLPEMMSVAPPSFADYMRAQAAVGRPITEKFVLRGAAAWASWAVDGLLVLATTVAIVSIAGRAPYCNVCRSWYRTVRTGALGGDAAVKLAEAASLRIAEPLGAAHYRLSHCASGCGPARLQLARDGAQGDARRCEAWLVAVERERVVKVLDNERGSS